MGASKASATRARTAVLISGRGSNLAALIDACVRPDAAAEIALVISNCPDAPGLQHARAAGIPIATVEHRGFETREDFEKSLNRSIEAADITLICLAGFMRLLSAWFTER